MMEKNSIKRFAIWARRELIEKIAKKAQQYGIEEGKELLTDVDSINGILLTDIEKKQRNALISKINEEGYTQVIEEVAYTWFNRFIALRYMEVNGYLPSHIRVFTDENNNFKPQMLSEALHLELVGIDKDKVYEMKSSNKDEELFRYLLTVQCNDLSSILPGMFQKIADYTELLIPDYLLRDGSVIEQLISCIPEEDWTNQIQIIGWLYQYYNSELKDSVFLGLKNNKKITKEKIAPATQLFTPDWIVRYMVENSVGRAWSDAHKESQVKTEWKYYIEDHDNDVQSKVQRNIDISSPMDIKAIDPCMGSGHILAYMFDVLVQIYESVGYSARDAASLIVENNIYGLDIDERAAQLSYFSIMMKARQYDRRFFTRNITPNVYAVRESNDISSYAVEHFSGNDVSLRKSIDLVIRQMKDAKEYGSIVEVKDVDWKHLFGRFEEINNNTNPSLYDAEIMRALYPLVRIAYILAQKYDVTITNPPYLSVSNAGEKLQKYIKDNYSDEKQDLYTVFTSRMQKMLKPFGYQAMIMQHGWMFLSSFETFRKKVLQNDIVNMLHLGPRAFDEINGEVVQTVSFVFRRELIPEYRATYVRLVDGQSESEKEELFLSGRNRFYVNKKQFEKITGNPVAYWVSDSILNAYVNGKSLSQVAEPKQGLKTGDNERFLRLWFEINKEKFSIFVDAAKWFPCNKGGEYRRWYGNNDYVINWENDGYELKNFKDSKGKLKSRPQNLQYMKREGLTYTNIGSGNLGIRYSPEGFLFDAAGSMIFTNKELLFYLLGYLGSKTASMFTKITSPTMSFEVGQLSTIPVLPPNNNRVDELVKECIRIAKVDWDSYETSWDFEINPLVNTKANTVSEAFEIWKKQCDERIESMLTNEEKINQYFIDAYGLDDELDAHVDEEDITLRKANLKQDIKDLISYAVGCMFGRYSLDVKGLVCAGTTVETNKYISYPVDTDNIIPICEDEYFSDDIVSRFVEFISITFGKETLEENLKFIADSIGKDKGTAREGIRDYFNNDFYADHCAKYSVQGAGKRPIYWLFDSGKKGGFRALVYMHRYKNDLLARIRTDYIHELQARYQTIIDELDSRVSGEEKDSQKIKDRAFRKKIAEKQEELFKYEEMVHHYADMMIDINLDDGIKKNYALFNNVLAKIK